MRNTFLVAVAALLLATGSWAAQFECERVEGSGVTAQSGPMTPFTGTATLNMGTADMFVVPTGPIEDRDGTLHANTSHVFDFGGGDSFGTADRAILSPTGTPGVYRLNSQLRIVQGTGAYENACGRLTLHGYMTFDMTGVGSTEWTVRGRVCDCGP